MTLENVDSNSKWETFARNDESIGLIETMGFARVMALGHTFGIQKGVGFVFLTELETKGLINNASVFCNDVVLLIVAVQLHTTASSIS